MELGKKFYGIVAAIVVAISMLFNAGNIRTDVGKFLNMPDVKEVTDYVLPEMKVIINGEEVNKPPVASCVNKVTQNLEKASEHAASIYKALQDKKLFTTWLNDCSDMISAVSTAAHESVHVISTQFQERGYYLITKKIATINEDITSNMPHPSNLLKIHKYDRKQPWVETYIVPGQASSHKLFHFLLDEFNAYTNDVYIQLQLMKYASWANTGQLSRAGFVSLMIFVADYITMIQNQYPQYWGKLKNNKDAIGLLWKQAEWVLAQTKNIPMDSMEVFAIDGLCDAKRTAAVGKLIERPIRACVKKK